MVYPTTILTNHGSQSVSNLKTKAPCHVFERFLEHDSAWHIVARRNHPQTNGKIDRLIAAGLTMDDVVDWQNRIRPHASLNDKVPTRSR